MGVLCSEPQNNNQFGSIKVQKLVTDIYEKDLQLTDEIKDARIQTSIKSTLSKLIRYQNQHLVQHLINQKDKKTALRSLQLWSTLKLQHLDMMYQNILSNIKQIEINKTHSNNKILVAKILMPKISMPKIIKRSNKEKTPEIFQHYQQKGQQLLKNNLIAILMFLPDIQCDKNNFQLLKKITNLLNEIIQSCQQKSIIQPFIVIYVYQSIYIKISQFIQQINKLKKNQIIVITIKTHPVIDQQGRLCLKCSDFSDFVEEPKGNDDFFKNTHEGNTIKEILMNKNIQYAVCIEVDQFTNSVINEFSIGYFAANKESFDIIYMCSQLNKDTKKIIVEKDEGIIIEDSYQSKLANIHQNTNKDKTVTCLQWNGMFIISIDNSSKINSPDFTLNNAQFIHFKQDKINFWNPQTKAYQTNKKCFIFYKPLHNLFKRLEKNKICGILQENQQKFKTKSKVKKPSNFDTVFF